ncbi:MAG: DUF2357 domain-containing protein [Candidatus Nanopelagicales bacterium]
MSGSARITLLPATNRLVETDRHYVRCQDPPKLPHGVSVGRTATAGTWELPAPSGQRGHVHEPLIIVIGGRRVRLPRSCQLPWPARNTHVVASDFATTIGSTSPESDEQIIAANLLDTFRAYGAFLDEFAGDDLDDPVVVRDGVHAWTTDRHLCERLDQFTLQSEASPPIAVIHRVLDRSSTAVLELTRSLRHQLERERRLIDLTRVAEVDDACINWMTRQPGRTIQERAGPRQRILAVTRRQSYDTFENRILKSFLQMADAACFEYLRLQAARQLPTHPRVIRVRSFHQHVRTLLMHPAIADLPAPASDHQPNYALQFERTYRAIWDGYRLLRSARRQDDLLWRWRHRTFGELVFLELLGALSSLCDPDCLPDHLGEVGVRTDPRVGHWLNIPCSLGARRCRLNGGDYDVAIAAPLHHEYSPAPDSPLVDVVITASAVDASDTHTVPILAIAGPAQTAPESLTQ